jgi:hypothetical protein
MKRIYFIMIILVTASGIIKAQDTDENKLKISGELSSEERFLLSDNRDWVWNENRLTLKINRNITDKSKFNSEIWVRNIGIPDITGSSDLFDKGIVDPINIEIREANIQIYGFLTKNLDIKIGRQIIAWGTADKINPTDNLNPYDLEDILDFGRHRGSDAITANYYFNSDFFIQGVYIPFFQPANMPTGLFADALSQSLDLPDGMTLNNYSDTILMPRYNLKESSTAGVRIKGYTKGIDMSLSYVWGYDGLPVSTLNTITPVDLPGNVDINSRLSCVRNHIIGADFVTSIGGAGFWGEAALFIPDKDVIMTTDLSALYPSSPDPVTVDSTIADKPYVRFILGGDYNFRDGSYINVQYLHGFFHEKGGKNMDDYFFAQYEKKFLNEKLSIAPVGGAFIVSDWKDIKNNSTIVYIPRISYKATDDAEISLSLAVFGGKGDNMFSQFVDYDMFMFGMTYNF